MHVSRYHYHILGQTCILLCLYCDAICLETSQFIFLLNKFSVWGERALEMEMEMERKDTPMAGCDKFLHLLHFFCLLRLDATHLKMQNSPDLSGRLGSLSLMGRERLQLMQPRGGGGGPRGGVSWCTSTVVDSPAM